jgi:hypothetical protein
MIPNGRTLEVFIPKLKVVFRRHQLRIPRPGRYRQQGKAFSQFRFPALIDSTASANIAAASLNDTGKRLRLRVATIQRCQWAR